jgi:hypothetical protein
MSIRIEYFCIITGDEYDDLVMHWFASLYNVNGGLRLRALPPVATSNPPARATGRGNCSIRARNLLQNFQQ